MALENSVAKVEIFGKSKANKYSTFLSRKLQCLCLAYIFHGCTVGGTVPLLTRERAMRWDTAVGVFYSRLEAYLLCRLTYLNKPVALQR